MSSKPELVRECEDRVRRNNSFDKEKWIKSISAKSVADGSLRSMILNYFISEGYESSAAMFAEEAGLVLGERNKEIIRIKDRVRQSLQDKQFDLVIEELNRYNSDLLQNNEEVMLNIQLLKYCDMIKKNEYDNALEFITEKTQGYLEKNKYTSLIEDHLLLIVMKDPMKSPSAHLLSESRVLDLNTRINKELNQRMDAEIIIMMKLMKWMEKRLNKNGKVPKLTNLSKLHFSVTIH